MSERFVFTQNPTVTELEQKAESAKGQVALEELQSEFTSVAEVLRHTKNNGAGNAVIHLPDGQNITLVNITRHEVVAAVQPYTSYLDANFFVGSKI